MESVGATRVRASERYVSLIKLAAGGTATVYAALDVSSGDLVALKRPHEHLASDPSFLRLLRAEVRIASRIVHPNVVPIIDVEQMDDVFRLVMPYVRGAALSELVVASPDRMDSAVALRIVADACAGLHAAHELRDDRGTLLGVIHRDVSPHNLMVGTDGVTRVTDFGIAKSVDASAEHSTTTGVLKGKFAYMAPEYIRGTTIDRRADLFALGVVLWEVLAGKRLFKGSNQVESSRNVVEMSVPSLGSVAPELARFDRLIAAALERSPDARVRTARAWLDEIERFPMATHEDVARMVEERVGDALAERQSLIQKRLLVMAEITSTGARSPRDTVRTTTGFDPEDLVPTLVMPIADLSGIKASAGASHAPVDHSMHAAEPSTIPEPRLVADVISLREPPLVTPRRTGWIALGALGLAAAGVIGVAALSHRARDVVIPTLAGERKTLVPSPSASEIEGHDPPRSIDVTALPEPSAATSHPQDKLRPTRATPSGSATPTPAASSPIIRNLDLGPDEHRRPNPYAK